MANDTNVNFYINTLEENLVWDRNCFTEKMITKKKQ